EHPLAAHRDCDRRPGDIRASRGVPGGGWLSPNPADGRHRALQAPQAREPAAVPARARHHLRSALGKAWRAQHDGPDVAAAAPPFLPCPSQKNRPAVLLLKSPAPSRGSPKPPPPESPKPPPLPPPAPPCCRHASWSARLQPHVLPSSAR